MTIRARLSLWYAGVMFVSLAAMGGLSYYEFVAEPRNQLLRAGNADPEEKADEGDFTEVVRIVLWCGVPAALLAIAGGWWLMRQALAPIAALTEATEKITERNLNMLLPVAGTADELDRLTEVFNAMMARLNDSFTRVRDFTLHASHELKTPLTIMHGEMETALRDEPLTAPQRERILSHLDEVQRLSKIVDGLTLLTRADAGQVQLKKEPVPLDELVREMHADTQILVETGSVKVELAECEPLLVQADRHRLRQVLLNLADNAVKYNAPEGWIVIALKRAGSSAVLTITNAGPGIPPATLPRVFDRFYRGDPAHGSSVDGCGLGLSIAQWIVSAHEGSLAINSLPGKHTTVTLQLPALASERGKM